MDLLSLAGVGLGLLLIVGVALFVVGRRQTIRDLELDEQQGAIVCGAKSFELNNLVEIQNLNAHGHHGGVSSGRIFYGFYFADGQRLHVEPRTPQAMTNCGRVEALHSSRVAEAARQTIDAGDMVDFGAVLLGANLLKLRSDGRIIRPVAVKIQDNHLYVRDDGNDCMIVGLNRIKNCEALLMLLGVVPSG